jgi:hypothetical protein
MSKYAISANSFPEQWYNFMFFEAAKESKWMRVNTFCVNEIGKKFLNKVWKKTSYPKDYGSPYVGVSA